MKVPGVKLLPGAHVHNTAASLRTYLDDEIVLHRGIIGSATRNELRESSMDSSSESPSKLYQVHTIASAPDAKIGHLVPMKCTYDCSDWPYQRFD